MKKRFVGHTGVSVSKVGFGTMSFGNEADAAESAKLFARCREVGINLFDTADVYAKGRSEEILGDLITGCRDEIVLATKATYPSSKDANGVGSSRYHLVRAVEGSLRRLKTDRIDIFYLHRFDERTDLDDALYTLELLVRQGKILYPAVSNFAAFQTQRAVDTQSQRGYAKLACIQPMYNLLKRQAEVEIFPMAQANGLAVFPYSPLAAGILTGKYLAESAPGVGRMLTNKAYQTRYGDAATGESAAQFVSLSRELGVTPAALAVAWVAAHPAVTAPLLGARNVAQLDAALGAIDLELDPATYARISVLSRAPASATDRTDDGTVHDMWKR